MEEKGPESPMLHPQLHTGSSGLRLLSEGEGCPCPDRARGGAGRGAAGWAGPGQTGICVQGRACSHQLPHQPGPLGTPQGWGLSQTSLKTAAAGASPRGPGSGSE